MTCIKKKIKIKKDKIKTEPLWLSGLEHQFNTWPMLKDLSLNPATATDKKYDGFSGCSFASILIDCIATITLSQVLDWARQLAINNRGNSRGG